MAAATAIAMMRNAALERIESVLSNHSALPKFEMPRQGNDPDLLMAKQLEAIADWLERNIHTIKAERASTGLSKMKEMEKADKPVVVNAWDLPEGVTYTGDGEPLAAEEETEPQTTALDFHSMTKAELKDYAERHEIDLGDARNNADIIAVLEADNKDSE